MARGLGCSGDSDVVRVAFVTVATSCRCARVREQVATANIQVGRVTVAAADGKNRNLFRKEAQRCAVTLSVYKQEKSQE